MSGAGRGVTELGIRHDLRRNIVEPRLECVQDRRAVLLPEAANAIGLRFARVGLSVSRLGGVHRLFTFGAKSHVGDHPGRRWHLLRDRNERRGRAAQDWVGIQRCPC